MTDSFVNVTVNCKMSKRTVRRENSSPSKFQQSSSANQALCLLITQIIRRWRTKSVAIE